MGKRNNLFALSNDFMLERERGPTTRSEIGKMFCLFLKELFIGQEVIAKNPREGTKYLVGVISRRL